MSHTTEWRTRVYLFEEDRTTKVRVELDTGTNRLTGHGTARCNPADEDVPEIGDELAAARALEDAGPDAAHWRDLPATASAAFPDGEVLPPSAVR
ncbi:dsRBD fold-containing protein, partial [Streptomyces sp. NPDC041003]|uniref:dsRBD fold-containing protein n=1 Tax=Streptomyces sp. NPDC041003 TaxID=3155730 RepID=UPI0033F9CDDE